MRRLLLIFILALSSMVQADDELSLYSSSGDAVAYIALSDELTIYLWSGKPVAYLSEDSSGDYHVYGFNGKHLGWFVGGVLRDHRGDAACALKEIMNSTNFESFKGFKQFKPFKAFKEFAPFRPIFSSTFGQIPCQFLLGSGL